MLIRFVFTIIINTTQEGCGIGKNCGGKVSKNRTKIERNYKSGLGDETPGFHVAPVSTQKLDSRSEKEEFGRRNFWVAAYFAPPLRDNQPLNMLSRRDDMSESLVFSSLKRFPVKGWSGPAGETFDLS